MENKEKKDKVIKLSEIQADTLGEGSRMAEQLTNQLAIQRNNNDKLLALILDSKDLKIADIEANSIRYLADEKSLSFKLK
jgi:hypothetical protein